MFLACQKTPQKKSTLFLLLAPLFKKVCAKTRSTGNKPFMISQRAQYLSHPQPRVCSAL